MTVPAAGFGERRLFVHAVAWCAAAIAFWALAYTPLARRLQMRRHQIVQLEDEWHRANRLLARREAFEAESHDTTRQIDGDDVEGGGFVRRIEAAARGCGVTVTAVQPQPDRRDGVLAISTVDVECQGAPAQVVRLLHALQTASPPMVARRLRLTAQPSSGAVLARLTLERVDCSSDAE